MSAPSPTDEGLPCPYPDCTGRRHWSLRSRHIGNRVRRLRKCRLCGRRFTSWEVLATEICRKQPQ